MVYEACVCEYVYSILFFAVQYPTREEGYLSYGIRSGLLIGMIHVLQSQSTVGGGEGGGEIGWHGFWIKQRGLPLHVLQYEWQR